MGQESRKLQKVQEVNSNPYPERLSPAPSLFQLKTCWFHFKFSSSHPFVIYNVNGRVLEK